MSTIWRIDSITISRLQPLVIGYRESEQLVPALNRSALLQIKITTIT